MCEVFPKKLVGGICREFRLKWGLTLSDISGNHKSGTVSAFECGRSNSLEIFLVYLEWAYSMDDVEQFINTLAEGLDWI